MEIIDYPLSERSYPLRLLMAQLNIENQTIIAEELISKQNISRNILKISPLGDYPILIDGDKTVWSSTACLIYIASKYDKENNWYPQAPEILAQIHEWLFIATELSYTIGNLRNHEIFLQEENDISLKKKSAYNLLKKFETQLWKNSLNEKNWLIGNTPTIADLVCFSHIIFSDQATISLMDFPHIKKWLKRIHNLPKFIEIPGTYS